MSLVIRPHSLADEGIALQRSLVQPLETRRLQPICWMLGLLSPQASTPWLVEFTTRGAASF